MLGLFECLISPIRNFFKGRYRLVNDRADKEPYLERYYLFLKERENFPFNIFLHKFLKSDEEDLHDHPWPYLTFILWGGYWEYTSKGLGDKHPIRHWRGPGQFRYQPANSLHRIELDKKEDGTLRNCWTLFMPGPKLRNWGFDVSGQWIPNENYLQDKKDE